MDLEDSCAKESLDFFSKPIPQTSILGNYWVPFSPISAISPNSPIEFRLMGSGDDFYNFHHSYLHMRLSVSNTPGDSFAAKACYPVNNLLHSMIRQVDCYLNDRLIDTSNNNYAYLAYFQDLINYGSDVQTSLLTSQLWKKDTMEHFDSFVDTENVGGFDRKKYFSTNAKISLCGRLHVDLFQQRTLIPNNVDIKLVITPNTSEFALMDNTAAKFKIKIEEVTLYVKKFQLNPEFRVSMEKQLSLENILYPMTRSLVKTYSIPSGQNIFNHENIFLGPLPVRILVAFVSSKAFYGDYASNPYNFHHFDLNFLALYKDGVSIPSKPYQPDFVNQDYSRCYMSLFEGTNSWYTNDGLSIDKLEYGKGYTIFAFDLTADQCEDDHFLNQNSGNIRLEAKFENVLTETVSVLIYADFNNTLEITQNRQILFDYAI